LHPILRVRYIKLSELYDNLNFITYSGIFRETYRKVPCITVLDGASIEMYGCKLKGDTTNDASTAGVVAINADI